MKFISLFSGIEAASVAWIPLGWECVAIAEIDKFPSAVLAHHYPGVPNLGDVKLITREMIAGLGHIDLVVFGFPCQDLSVAGKRAGLKGARSGLFFEAMRIVEWCREFCGAKWTVVENVPGLLSSTGGDDFAAVVGELAGTRIDVPKGGWKNVGVALGPHGLVEWSILDAQWFGVPQRRRRVFLVRNSGDWRSSESVLSIGQSLSGDSAPSREKRESAPRSIAPCIGSSGRGFSRVGDPRGQDCLVTTSHDPACTLTAREFKGPLPEADLSTVVAHTIGAGYWREGFGTLRGREQDSHENLVSHALRADGFDASEDRTGRGTPLVPVPHVETLPTMRSSAAQDGPGHAARSGDCKDEYIVPVAFNLRGREEGSQPEVDPENLASLRSPSGGSSRSYVTAELAPSDSGWSEELTAHIDLSGTIQYGGQGGRHEGIMSPTMAVRRLTPRECERLQGFPDDYTLITYNNKPAADGPRYKSLGNSFAVPVVRWIGRRIQMVDAICRAYEELTNGKNS